MKAFLAALVATLAAAPTAQAAPTTRVSFDFMEGAGATVELDFAPVHTRFDLTRGGALIANSTTSQLSAGALFAGDLVTVYDGATVVATATYDGLPTIGESACIGRSAFGAQRGKTARMTAAGAYHDELGEAESFFTNEETALVSFKRPLMAGDVAYAQTYLSDGVTAISSLRSKQVKLCSETDVPTQIVPPPTGPVPPPSAPPKELVPTQAEMAKAVRGSLSATGASLRARTTRRLAKAKSVALPFAFPEAGRVELRLTAGKVVIAGGAKTSAVNGKAILSIKLTAAGRKLLKRAKKLKVTVNGAFTPSRNGAETSRATSTVTLKR